MYYIVVTLVFIFQLHCVLCVYSLNFNMSDNGADNDSVKEEDISIANMESLLQQFKAMGATPKDIQQWIATMSQAKELAFPPPPTTTVESHPTASSNSQSPTVLSTTTVAAATTTTSSTTLPVISASVHHFPKISSFSGDKSKDIPYETWKHEVVCIQQEGHSASTVAQAIRSSLKGQALGVYTRLGANSSVQQIIHKFDSIFGNVDTPEMTLSLFYSARQRQDEDVANWSWRLEEILAKASETMHFTATESNKMLCSMFWRGLSQNIKDITGHIFERETDFDQLRVHIRRIEQECKIRKQEERATTVPVKAAQKKETSDVEKLTAMVNQLATDFRKFKDGSDHDTPPQYNRDRRPHKKPFNRQRSYNSNGNRDFTQQRTDKPICYKCGQKGHFAIGCAATRDEVAEYQRLNPNRSAQRDRR